MLGEEQPATLVCMLNVAVLYRCRGGYSKAESLMSVRAGAAGTLCAFAPGSPCRRLSAWRAATGLARSVHPPQSCPLHFRVSRLVLSRGKCGVEPVRPWVFSATPFASAERRQGAWPVSGNLSRPAGPSRMPAVTAARPGRRARRLWRCGTLVKARRGVSRAYSSTFGAQPGTRSRPANGAARLKAAETSGFVRCRRDLRIAQAACEALQH